MENLALVFSIRHALIRTVGVRLPDRSAAPAAWLPPICLTDTPEKGNFTLKAKEETTEEWTFTVAHRSLLGTLSSGVSCIRGVKATFGGVWNALASCRPAGGVRLTVSLSYLHSHGPLPKKTPTSPAPRLDHGIYAPAIIVPPPSFLLYSDRYANPSIHINTHQMLKGVRWKGRNQQTANGIWCFQTNG